jgi:hypothetical protein
MMVSYVEINTSSRFDPIPGYDLPLHDHTHLDTAIGKTLLDEWSTQRRNLYLKTHNTHEGQSSMPPAGLESTIPPNDALDRAATGIGSFFF